MHRLHNDPGKFSASTQPRCDIQRVNRKYGLSGMIKGLTVNPYMHIITPSGKTKQAVDMLELTTAAGDD